MQKNYTVNEVAKKLRVSERTVLREIKRGNLKPQKVGRRYLIPRKALNDYLKKDLNIDLNRNIADFFDKESDEMVTLIQKLVSIPSESRKSQYDNLAKYLKAFLEKKGIRCVIHGKGESVSVHGSLGYAKRGVLFDCPLDTAPVGDREKWKYPPFDGVIKNGKMYGRGTADCKGGTVAMIYAALALKKYADKNNFRVELVFDGGEHSGAYDGMRETLKRGLKVDTGIVGYGGSGNNVAIGCRGYHRYELVSKGHSVHTGARFKAGVNAITNMAVLINELEHVRFPKPTNKYFNFRSKLNVVLIEGGKAVNILPDECRAHLDVRTTPKVKRSDIEKMLNRVIESAKHRYKGFDIKKNYLVGQEGYVIDEEEKLVDSLRTAVIQVKRKKPALIVHGPAHIGTLLATKGIPVIVWGPDGGNLHSYNEYVEIASISKTAEVYARTILNYFDIV